jgi:hypothetical protein
MIFSAVLKAKGPTKGVAAKNAHKADGAIVRIELMLLEVSVSES